MFQYNPTANYQPDGGRYLQILSNKDLYKQTIVVSARDTFPARFPNIFVDYPFESMKVGSKLWTNWNHAGINFIHNHPPGTRLEGSKNPPPGTIILYKSPPLGTIQGVKSPTPRDIKLETFTNVSINSDTV